MTAGLMTTHERRGTMYSSDSTALDVLVIGAGQSGLAVGWHLAQHRTRFLLVDAAPEMCHTWSNRWDSLRLFSPAEHDSLPGLDFPAAPGTYPGKDDVADYLARYADAFHLPVLLNCAVTRLTREGGIFAVHTSQGVLRARQVVVATGAFHHPVTPALAAGLGQDVVQVHSAVYRRPEDLPEGPVVVVGSGNSGMQIAAELAATRPVTLAVGTTGLQLPQRLAGRDLFWWLTRLGVLSTTADSLLARRMRRRGDLVIGSSLRELRRTGIILRPRVTAAGPDGVTFADGHTERPTAVVWATGFRSDYGWVEIPGAIDDAGQVRHRRGVSEAPGLYFIGLPWQHTRGSALLGFVQHDARWLAETMRSHRARRPSLSQSAQR
jgi:putative flavoprotein involved in K+ transport